MKIQSYSIEKPIKGISKQYGVWAKSMTTNSIMPLIYLQKPKHISDNKWDIICNSISINLPVGFET